MERVAVNSSHIARVGYEDGVMEVEFKRGGLYRGEVPEERYEAMIKAESIGAYFNALKVKYRFEKVERGY